MRIVCPNCRAEYDISADAIPPEGRELQCSSCEYTWFVAPLQVVGRPRDAAFVSRRRELDLPDLPQNADGPGEDEPFEDEEADEDAPDFPLKRRNPNLSAQLQALASELGPSAFAPEDEEPELPLDPPMAAPKRQVDPEVLAVLRQEAEVETKARRQEARVALESQLELGEFPQPRRSTAASELHERLERLKAAERKNRQENWASGEETYPDVTAIGETLRAKAARFASGRGRGRGRWGRAAPASGMGAPDDPQAQLPATIPDTARDLAIWQEKRQRQGFRLGFALPIFAAGLALGLYFGAEPLVRQWPELAMPLARLQAELDGGLQILAQLAHHLAQLVSAALSGDGAAGEF